jgi:hypothetical protein
MAEDRGIWATWYDLPEEGEAEYLSWFHERYLPEACSRQGYLWGAHYELMDRRGPKELNPHVKYSNDPSIPSGTEFLVLFGAESPYTFMDPGPAQLAEKESTETREMLGRRVGERTCIFSEEFRLEGPKSASWPSGTMTAPVVQIGTFNLGKPEDELEMGTWYAQSRLPNVVRVPECIRVRKLLSSVGWTKHSILYELASTNALKQFPSIKNTEGAVREWAIRVVETLIHAPGSPTVGTRIWPPLP